MKRGFGPSRAAKPRQSSRDKGKKRTLDSSYTANYISPINFKNIYDVPPIIDAYSALDVHKYLMVLHDICLDNIHTSAEVDENKLDVLEGIQNGIIKFMVTAGDDVKKAYGNKESENWTMSMFAFVTLCSLICFASEDFITDYCRLAKDTPAMYTTTRAIQKKKLHNVMSLKRNGTLAYDIEGEEEKEYATAKNALEGRSKEPVEKKTHFTKEEIEKLCEWNVIFTKKQTTDMTIEELYGSIKCTSMRWRSIKIITDEDYNTLAKHVMSLAHHCAFLVTGCVPEHLCDDEYEQHTKTKDVAQNKVKMISEAFLAYASGAFTFMWRSLEMHATFVPQCRDDESAAYATSMVPGFDVWLENSLEATASKKQLAYNIITSMTWMSLRPGEEELYTFLEHTEMKNTSPNDILMRLRTESQYSYYTTRLKGDSLAAITAGVSGANRDIVSRKVVNAYFVTEHGLNWDEIAYLDECDYYNRKTKASVTSTTTPVVVKVMGSYYVTINGEATGKCEAFSAAFAMWLYLVGEEPYNMILQLQKRTIKLHNLYEAYKMWAPVGGDSGSEESVDMGDISRSQDESNSSDGEEDYIPRYITDSGFAVDISRH